MIATYWAELTAVGLLGTDRRSPPAAPGGPLADLAADRPAASEAAHLLQQAAAAAVLQRAAFTPAAPTVHLPAWPADDRPPTPPRAEASFRRIVHQWPVLLAEWLDCVVANGWRLGPELVIPALVATRQAPTLSAAARTAIGPLAEWLVELWPGLVPAARTAPAEAGPLPLTADLAALLTAEPARVATTLRAALESGQYGASHRGVLVNLVVSLPHSALRPLARALDTIDPLRPAARLAASLAELAVLRADARAELERS